MYGSVVGESGVKIEREMDAYLLEIAKSDLTKFRERHIVGGVLNDTNFKAMHSTLARHSPPLSINLMTNTLLKLTDPDTSIVLEVTNHPMSNEMANAMYGSSVDGEMASYVLGILVPIGLALLTASYVILPIEEQRCAVSLVLFKFQWLYPKCIGI